MDEDQGLEQLDRELSKVVRQITVTPDGHLLTGWTKAEAALILADLAEELAEDVVSDLRQGRE